MSPLARPTAMRMTSIAIATVLVALTHHAHADELKVGDRVSELDTAVDAKGKSFKIKAFKGKWLMLTFGASWCKPCAKELPAWDGIVPDWKAKVEFIAVDLDESTDEGKQFHDGLKLKNMTRAYLSPNSAVAAKYGAEHMPTTVLADPQGVIRYIRGGFEKGDVDREVKNMKEQLAKLVK
jgi:thiol-disulfide isomerase/thioredoxin